MRSIDGHKKHKKPQRRRCQSLSEFQSALPPNAESESLKALGAEAFFVHFCVFHGDSKFYGNDRKRGSLKIAFAMKRHPQSEEPKCKFIYSPSGSADAIGPSSSLASAKKDLLSSSSRYLASFIASLSCVRYSVVFSLLPSL